MVAWKNTVKLGYVWQNDDLSFEEKRDEVVARLRQFEVVDEDYAGWPDPCLEELLDELAETDDEDYFNMVWDAVYDWADTDHRLWIDLYG